MSNSYRDVLNTHKWKTETLDKIKVCIVHRGAPNDQRTIPGILITEITGTGFYYQGDEYTFIPYHRIIEIKDA